jgi:hypothetical protein
VHRSPAVARTAPGAPEVEGVVNIPIQVQKPVEVTAVEVGEAPGPFDLYDVTDWPVVLLARTVGTTNRFREPVSLRPRHCYRVLSSEIRT